MFNDHAGNHLSDDDTDHGETDTDERDTDDQDRQVDATEQTTEQGPFRCAECIAERTFSEEENDQSDDDRTGEEIIKATFEFSDEVPELTIDGSFDT